MIFATGLLIRICHQTDASIDFVLLIKGNTHLRLGLLPASLPLEWPLSCLVRTQCQVSATTRWTMSTHPPGIFYSVFLCVPPWEAQFCIFCHIFVLARLWVRCYCFHLSVFFSAVDHITGPLATGYFSDRTNAYLLFPLGSGSFCPCPRSYKSQDSRTHGNTATQGWNLYSPNVPRDHSTGLVCPQRLCSRQAYSGSLFMDKAAKLITRPDRPVVSITLWSSHPSNYSPSRDPMDPCGIPVTTVCMPGDRKSL